MSTSAEICARFQRARADDTFKATVSIVSEVFGFEVCPMKGLVASFCARFTLVQVPCVPFCPCNLCFFLGILGGY